MERIVDKLILSALCAYSATALPVSTGLVMTALIAISLAALGELEWLPAPLRWLLPLAYVTGCLLQPVGLAFLPLVAYDCFRLRWSLDPAPAWIGPVRFSWALPLIVEGIGRAQTAALAWALMAALACLLAWRTVRDGQRLRLYRARRDELSQAAQALERRNRDLEERQSMELRLATLSERGRIAREIHDNVGHLLTRGVLQVEALQVVHADDPALSAQLADVSWTLNQAFATVRQSVHDLRDEAFDLPAQLAGLVEQVRGLPRPPGDPAAPGPAIGPAGGPAIGPAGVTDQARPAVAIPGLAIDLTCDLGDPPPPAVSNAVLAIVREALANTLRHSDATSVRVSLVEYAGFYQLVVHDDGRTPPAPAGRAEPGVPSGMGLDAMAERVRGLGGVLRTSWQPGFKVYVSIPKAARVTPAVSSTHIDQSSSWASPAEEDSCA